jgi:hypothetical protein
MKFRKKSIEIEATQWFKNGDHPDDGCVYLTGLNCKVEKSEGKVVKYYKATHSTQQTKCSKCGKIYQQHGWVDTLEGGHIVCPGDWIITGIEGERYPCKNEIFRKTYENSNPEEDSNEILNKILSYVSEISLDGVLYKDNPPLYARGLATEIQRLHDHLKDGGDPPEEWKKCQT